MNNTEILASVARAVNDATFSKRSKSIMLGMITDAQNHIIGVTECLRKINSTDIVLVADTGEYSMPNEFVKFPSDGGDTKRGCVSLGTTGKFPLTNLHISRLNNSYPGWRNASSGTPEFCYFIGSGTAKLGIYPKPSSSFITTNGSSVIMDIVYKPTSALLENASLPFDGSQRFDGLFQILLKLRSIWQIKTEDMQFQDADRLDKTTEKLFEQAIDFVQSTFTSPGNHGFEEDIG